MNTILPFLYLNEYHSTISLLITNTCIGISLVLVSRHRGWWSVHHTSYTIITTNLSVTQPCLRTTNKQCGDISYLLSHFSLVSCLLSQLHARFHPTLSILSFFLSSVVNYASAFSTLVLVLWAYITIYCIIITYKCIYWKL